MLLCPGLVPTSSSTHTFGCACFFSACAAETTGLPYLQETSKSVEEPAVTVDLLLILLLHTKDDLRGHDTLVRIFEVQVRVEREGCRVLEQMCSDRLMVDSISHVTTRLIHAKKSQTVEDAWVDFPATVSDDAYNHLVQR